MQRPRRADAPRAPAPARACRPGCGPRRRATCPAGRAGPASAPPRSRSRSPPGRADTGAASAMRMPWATAAFRRWCGPASAERAGPFVLRRQHPHIGPAPTVRPDRPPDGPPGAAPRPAPGSVSPITNGAPGLAMPAFSRAISSSVSPRYFMWSRSILVTALTSGRTTLVLSSRPPSPTSTTAISAPRAAKSAKAIAVRRLEEGGLALEDQRQQAARSTSPPPPRRSARRPPGCARGTRPGGARCRARPASPPRASAAATRVETLPLPLVPPT